MKFKKKTKKNQARPGNDACRESQKEKSKKKEKSESKKARKQERELCISCVPRNAVWELAQQIHGRKTDAAMDGRTDSLVELRFSRTNLKMSYNKDINCFFHCSRLCQEYLILPATVVFWNHLLKSNLWHCSRNFVKSRDILHISVQKNVQFSCKKYVSYN